MTPQNKKKCFWGVGCGRCLRRTASPPTVGRLSRQCGVFTAYYGDNFTYFFIVCIPCKIFAYPLKCLRVSRGSRVPQVGYHWTEQLFCCNFMFTVKFSCINIVRISVFGILINFNLIDSRIVTLVWPPAIFAAWYIYTLDHDQSRVCKLNGQSTFMTQLCRYGWLHTW
jgi:hypothetical protein